MPGFEWLPVAAIAAAWAGAFMADRKIKRAANRRPAGGK